MIGDMKPRIHYWHVVFGLLFVVLVAWGTLWLSASGKLIAWVSLGDFLLMALAIMRLTRLVCYDSIMGFVRDWFRGADPYTLRGTLDTLINCPWCMGLWFSFFVPFFYFATPYAAFVIFMLALAAVGSFLQLLANLVGWSAEAKKREANSIAVPR